LRKHLKTVALLLIAICILWRLWRRLNWTEVSQSFSQANSFLVAASVAVSCGTNLLRAGRWRTLLSPLVPTHLHEVFAATNIGIGASFIFGGAVGEVVRPLALSLLSKQVRPAASFLTIVVERVFDLCALSMLFGLTLLWLPEITGRQTAGPYLSELGTILLVLPAMAICWLVLFRSHSGVRQVGSMKSLSVDMPIQAGCGVGLRPICRNSLALSAYCRIRGNRLSLLCGPSVNGSLFC
jgi:uncharacterized membrane protein YbhN (UPF0104 family)